LEAREGEDLALNATGGTKPMSIAAYQAFRDRSSMCIRGEGYYSHMPQVCKV
jgi:hypothetical protein